MFFAGTCHACLVISICFRSFVSYSQGGKESVQLVRKRELQLPETRLFKMVDDQQ